MNSRNFVKLLAAATVAGLAFLGTAIAPLAAGNSSYVPPIDTNNRAQVASTYLSAVANNLALSSGWDGSTSNCDAGSASDSYDSATIQSINWFRRMSGLSAVTEDTSASRQAQQTALMMHAQNNLSHFPNPSWKCHTTVGATTAAVSNLTLGIVGPRGVVGQMEDPGAGNEALGHRRWLLFPELDSVGVANTSRASVVQVIGEFGTRTSRSNWVSWPPPGFVPDETVFDRWSVSFAGTAAVNFTEARVSVSENGRPMNVNVLPVSRGFGDPAVAFEVNGIRPEASGDVRYDVVVSNIVVNGRNVNHAYSFTSFDVNDAQPATVYRCQGRPATILGTAGADTIRGTSGADVIVALGGDDSIYGLGGADIICAGAGNDLVRAGWGNDVVLGGAGRDRLLGSRGNDSLLGQGGRDELNGGLGADTLVGGAHGDVLTGGVGNDVCWGLSAGQARATSADRRACERGR